MGLRVTHGILMRNALVGITTNALRLNGYREQLSTGLRINRPSDDPTTFLRILPLKNDIESVRRFEENALIARDILTTGSAAFEDATSLMSEAKRIAVQGANGSLNASDRKTLGASVQQMLTQLVSISNSRLGDRYLFGGSSTSQPPFTLTDDANATFVTYEGNTSEVGIEIAPGQEVVISQSGRDFFLSTKRGDTRITGSTGAAPGTGTDSGKGRARLDVEHTGFSGLPAGISAGATASVALGGHAFAVTASPSTISIGGGPAVPFDATSTNLRVPVGAPDGDPVYLDLSGYTGGATTGSLTSTARMSWDAGQTWTDVDFTQKNQQLGHASTGRVLNVNATGITRAGSDEVVFAGTFDPFHALIALRDLLNNKENLSQEEVGKKITEMIGELDSAADQVLEGLRDLGARSAQLDLTRNRMSTLELTLQQSLSRDSDIDIAETVLRMTQTDTAYQASLAVGARVISQTLLDYL